MRAAVAASAFARRRRPRRRRRRRRQHVLVHPGGHRGVRRHGPRARRRSGCPSARAASSSSPAACRAATATSSPRRCPRSTRSCPSPTRARCVDVLERLTGVSSATRRGARCADAHRVGALGLPAGLRRLPPRAAPTARSRRSAAPTVSRPLADIVAEARELVALGAREIVLIGQDITAYGRDLDGADTLADVVRAVAAVPGVDWLRLMYVAARRRHRRAARGDGREPQRVPLPRHAAPARSHAGPARDAAHAATPRASSR